MPFNHLSLAEVAESERLLRLEWRGKLYGRAYASLHRLIIKRHPPIYEPPQYEPLPTIA